MATQNNQLSLCICKKKKMKLLIMTYLCKSKFFNCQQISWKDRNQQWIDPANKYYVCGWYILFFCTIDIGIHWSNTDYRQVGYQPDMIDPHQISSSISLIFSFCYQLHWFSQGMNSLCSATTIPGLMLPHIKNYSQWGILISNLGKREHLYWISVSLSMRRENV